MVLDCPLYVDEENILERKADSKGRIAVGPERAGKSILVAVLDELGPEELDKIERRLRDEKHFDDEGVEMAMAVIEEEILGETDRDAADWHYVNENRVYRGGEGTNG